MTGTFRNGVIIPERPGELAEGTIVDISIRQSSRRDSSAANARPNLRLVEWLRQREPMSAEEAADWRRSMAEVHAAREEDVALEEAAAAARRSNGHQP